MATEICHLPFKIARAVLLSMRLTQLRLPPVVHVFDLLLPVIDDRASAFRPIVEVQEKAE